VRSVDALSSCPLAERSVPKSVIHEQCEDLDGNAFQEGTAELEIYEQKHTWLVDMEMNLLGAKPE
jgi:hypothetical protein